METQKTPKEIGPKAIKSSLVAIIPIAIAAILFIVIFLSKSPAPDSTREDAIYASMELLKQKLKAPSTADFPSVSKARYSIEMINDETIYVVSSYVDAQNSFGAMIRTNYTIKMRKSGDKYYLIDIKTW